MNRRLLTILFSAFVIAAICAFLVYRVIGNRLASATNQSATTKVVAAAADFKLGTLLTPANLTTIEIAMNMQPVSANTQATRGLILYLLGRTEEAKRDFDEALAKNSAIAEALYCRAAILEKSGLTEQATQDYSQAMKLEFKLPPFSTYSLGLGPFAWHKPDAENSTDT